MVNRYSYHKRYMGNQAACEPTDTDTDQTKEDSSPCHFYPKCHMICSSSKQTEIEWNNKCSSKIRWEALTQCIRYQQMYIYMCNILSYLRDSLIYMRQVAIHKMDYVDAATTNILSPDIIPVEDLRNTLRHIVSELPSTMHLPISLDDTLYFYQYLNIHVLIGDGQFLLLTDVSIQNRAQQLQIYEVFSLPLPHSNLSSQYKINQKYIGVTYDETKAVAFMDQQCRACKHANGQFCRINSPFQSLRNPPLCITALYARNNQAIKEQCSW